MNPSDESPARAPMPPSCDLSVIVPTYNYDAWIESALRSVLAQVPASAQVEIVVADDGSTDDTAQVVKALAADLPIRYLHQTNSGPASARNLAMSQAGGRYLMFLDSDDSLQPGCIETTLAFLEQHPEVGLFFTNYDIYDEQGVVTASGVDTWSGFRGLAHREVGDGEWVFSESLTPHLIGGGSFMHTSGLTIRREVYEQIGPFREGYSYGEDDEFYARAAWVTTAGYVDRVLSRKRNHKESLIHAPQNALRNDRQILELAEIQAEYYVADPHLRRILERKIRDCAVGYCWHLIVSGEISEARKALRKYRALYPLHPAFYRLMLRSLFAPRRV